MLSEVIMKDSDDSFGFGFKGQGLLFLGEGFLSC